MIAGNKRKAPDDAAEVEGPAAAARPLAGSTFSGSMPGAPGPGRPHRPAPGLPADGYFRRLYDSEPDFGRLAKQDSRFAAV